MVESEHPFPNDDLLSLLTDGSPSYPGWTILPEHRLPVLQQLTAATQQVECRPLPATGGYRQNPGRALSAADGIQQTASFNDALRPWLKAHDLLPLSPLP